MTGKTSSEPSPTITAPPWRRIAAYFVDYFPFVVPLLGVLGLAGWAPLFFDTSPFSDNAWFNHGIVILVLTVPIALYFAISEASRSEATIVKRLVKLSVVNTDGKRATLKQTALRAVGKFLPWEYFRAIMWHWEGWPTNPTPPTTIQIIAMAVGWIVIGWFIVSLFVGPSRTPCDWAAGTIVVQRPSTLARTGSLC